MSAAPKRRDPAWRAHAPLLVLLALAAPLLFAFVWQDGLATLNDDSVSYLTLARYLGRGEAIVVQWAGLHAHFPPLFPLALLATGGSENLRIAHLVVAAFGVAALVLIHRFAAQQFGRNLAGLIVVVAFLLTPTAWISLKGIMSESMYLFLSLAALCLHAARLDPAQSAVKPTATDWVAFGLLLGCVYLTRAAGVALILAYALHAGRRILFAKERPAWPLLLPAVPVIVLAGIWRIVRPVEVSDSYGKAASDMVSLWISTPGEMIAHSSHLLLEGWIASFNAYTVSATLPILVFALLGVLGIAGALRRAWLNRLDGWYVVVSLAVTVVWAFPEDTIRRLLYPLVPLLLIHAGQIVLAGCRKLGIERYRALALFIVAAFPAALCAPAMVLMLQKAADRAPAIPGKSYSYADMTDNYRIVSIPLGRELAGKQMAVLVGLGAISEVTPPGARVMWMRPEYVAILGKRAAVPFEYAWDPLTLAREVARSGTDYIVAASVFKADITVRAGDPNRTLRGIEKYSHPVFAVPNPHNGATEFYLMEVDPAALAAFLEAPG